MGETVFPRDPGGRVGSEGYGWSSHPERETKFSDVVSLLAVCVEHPGHQQMLALCRKIEGEGIYIEAHG